MIRRGREVICAYDAGFQEDSPVGAIKRIAEDEVKKLRTFEMAQVISVYPHSDSSDVNNYECDVRLKNGDYELRKVPIVTPHIGFAHIPNVGDLVLIGFVSGSVNAPVILGSLYNADQNPPKVDAGEIIYESPDAKKNGLRRFYFKLDSGIEITLTDDEFKADMGKTTIKITRDGDVEVSSSAKVTIKADKDMDLSAQNIKIESQGSVKIKGGSGVDISSDADAKVQASGQLNLKGSIVNIN